MQKFEFTEELKAAEFFHDRVFQHVFEELRPLEAAIAPCCSYVAPETLSQQPYQPVSPGKVWGKVWDHAAFRLSFSVPDEWQGQEIALRVNCSGEMLVFDAAGNALAGLTNASIFADYDKTIFRIPRQNRYDAKMTFYLDAAAYGFYGGDLNKKLESGHQEPAFEAKLQYADVGKFREDVWQFCADLEILISLARSLNGAFPAGKIVHALSRAQAVFKEDPEHCEEARQVLQSVLTCDGALPIHAAACGHGHVDVGWLWPISEGINKAARTFSSQIDLLNRYPEYVFGASQPFLYDAVKSRYPGLYAQIREMVRAGRWELQGGTWVEADANLSSPESLIRQFLHGKNFYMDEFGIEVRSLWLPDVFGYSPLLPQIIRKCRCDFFLTQKISWNQINLFPHHTFFWEGIDGSKVLSHFPPENSYAGNLLPEELRAGAERFSENDRLPEFLVLFGIGDGGGGPCDSHVEHGLRMQHLTATPQLHFSRSDDFFRRLLPHAGELATWRGELYLENHRGTLTSQAGIKKQNRKMEYLLAAVEVISSLLPDAEYPAETLSRLWRSLLTRQFHDILPGSSIAMVYQQCSEACQADREVCRKLIRHAAEKNLIPSAGKAVYFNPLSFPYTFPLALPEGWEGADLEGAALETTEFAGKRWVMAAIPAFSSLELTRSTGCAKAAVPQSDARELVLENEFLRVTFNQNGEMLSCMDRQTGRETLKGKGNVLALYNDHPNEYDAWNVDHFYPQMLLENAQGEGKRTAASSLRFELKIGNSKIHQEVRLLPGTAFLEFDTQVEWHESHRMLRCVFESAIRSEQARFDMQYGWINRTTAENDLADMARFETVMHRYVDLADQDGGVALLNDCKYGGRVRGGRLELALLRSPKYPDAQTDQGMNHFRYAWMVRSGTPQNAGVAAAAANFNRPPLLLDGFSGSLKLPFRFTAGGIEVTVVKRSEKDLSAWILRLVETDGRSHNAELEFNAAVTWTERDMLEWHDLTRPQTDRKIHLQFTPFEIKTLRIIFN